MKAKVLEHSLGWQEVRGCCNEGKAKQLFHFCPRTSANSSPQVSISCQIKSMSPEEARDSFCTTHPFLRAWAWEGLHHAKQKKKEKRITGHLSSQWLHTPVHPSPSGQMLMSIPINPSTGVGLPLSREGAVQLANIYTHRETFHLYL